VADEIDSINVDVALHLRRYGCHDIRHSLGVATTTYTHLKGWLQLRFDLYVTTELLHCSLNGLNRSAIAADGSAAPVTLRYVAVTSMTFDSRMRVGHPSNARQIVVATTT